MGNKKRQSPAPALRCNNQFLNNNSRIVIHAERHIGRSLRLSINYTNASDTSSVPAVTQENGAEIIAGNIRRGQFTMLTPTSKV